MSAPPGRPRFPALDGMRALAAFGVLATHAGFASGRAVDNSPWAPFLSRLDFGVTLFFLLSGFVIYRPFIAAALAGSRQPPTGRFLLRRFVRILPAYWLAVVVTLTLLSPRPIAAGQWVSYLLLAQTYDHNNLDPSLTQMWTLSVELSFYLLVPLLACWACTRAPGNRQVLQRNLVLIVAMAVVAAGFDVAAHVSRAIDFRSLIWLPANLDWFASGMLLALISAWHSHHRNTAEPTSAAREPGWFLTARTLTGATGLCWTTAALLFWLATLPLGGPRDLALPGGWEWAVKHYLYGGCALLLLAPLTLAPAGRLSSALSRRVPRFLGEISYGIYLWHLGLLLAIQRWLGFHTFEGHFLPLLGLTVLASVLAASLSWKLLEQPLMRLAGRGQSGRAGSPGSASDRAASPTSATSTSP